MFVLRIVHSAKKLSVLSFDNIMKEKIYRCIPKPSLEHNASSKSRLNELISWRILRKNPSGALIWGIFGASLVMDGYFFWDFLNHKEYQVTNIHHVFIYQ